MKTLEELKREVFRMFLDLSGRAYIHVRHSPAVRLGRRGFMGTEKEKGIVLVINSQMKYAWDGEGLHATLVFGSATEKCFIPTDDIVAVYCPELGAQFTVSPDFGQGEESERRREPDDNLIKVDFTKGKQ